jgi:hypothetical protein
MNNLAREVAERNHRLGKDAKPEPIQKQRRQIFAWVRPDQDEHVKAWWAHHVICDDYALVGDFIKAICFVHGMAEAEVYRARGGMVRVEARYQIIRIVAARYPGLSSTKLGRIFKKDHTVILYCLRRLGDGVSKRPAKLTREQVIDIRARAARGQEMQKDLADIFGVSKSFISAIVCGRRMRGVA